MRGTGHSWLLVGWQDLGPTVYDPLLGWTNAPSVRLHDFYGPGAHLTTNSRGFRGKSEHPDAKPPGTVRVLFLGDSFTDGLGVDDDDVYPAQLERISRGVQTVNMAKISYGIDQAVLRYERDARDLAADWVVLAAIDDNLNRARRDRFNGYWPKPRFEINAEGSATVVGVPVPDFSEPITGPFSFFQRAAVWLIPRRFWAESFYSQNDRTLASAILSRFLGTAASRGHRAALVYLPTLEEARAGAALPLAKVMADFAASASIPFLDLTPGFAESGTVDSLYLTGNAHFSPDGHRLAARSLAETLDLVATAVQ